MALCQESVYGEKKNKQRERKEGEWVKTARYLNVRFHEINLGVLELWHFRELPVRRNNERRSTTQQKSVWGTTEMEGYLEQ